MELEIINGTEKLLNGLGKTEVVYLTAEFEPFTNQQKPDLMFIGNRKKDCVFFVEYKMDPKLSITDSYISNIIENKKFVGESIEQKLFYAFATNCFIDNKLQDILLDNGIVVFNNINSSEALYTNILEWYENEQ